MAQNMKLSLVGLSEENVIVEVNNHETFNEFQEKVIREHNLCITIEDFQLFFENLLPESNLFNCLRENLNIVGNNLENAPIYEINIVREITSNIKDENNSSFTINDAIENATAEHFQNLDPSIMVLNQEQSPEYTVLNENIFEASDSDKNNKKVDQSNQGLTLYSENNVLMTKNLEVPKHKREYVNKKKDKTKINRPDIEIIENSEKEPEQNHKNYNYMDIESKMAEMHDCNEEATIDLCRLCAKNITDENKIEIYKDNDELKEKINSSLPIEIKKEDGLPEQICSSCSDKIKNYYEFIQIVLEADKQLRVKFLRVLNNDENLNNSSVSEFMSEFLSSSPKPTENSIKNIKFEPEDAVSNSENDFETEYLETEEVEKPDNEKPNCRLCDLIIDSSEGAKSHAIRSHHINDLYACIFCELGFQKSESLSEHIQLEHNNLFSRKFQCIVCSKKYSSQFLLLKHTCVKSAANKTLQCEICNQSFHTKVRLNFHRQFHLKDARPLNCAMCNTTFENENEFFDHVNFMHDSKQSFPCDTCDKTFSIRAALNNHKKVHSGVRNHKCNICDKTFLDKQTLKEHEVSHMETKPYQCHICGKNLNRLSRLRRHLLSHESNLVLKNVHVCIFCNEAFANENFANFHKTRKHDGFNCIKIDKIDKVFRCEFCEKCYYTPAALNEHRTSHTGPTPYSCHICKAQFSTYPRCTTHKTTHGLYKDGAEKDNFPVVKHFLCEHCGKSYLHWSYLGLHRRLKHSENIQVYKCSDCKLQFPNSWGLAYHRKTKHGSESFKCNECDRNLGSDYSLKLHMLVKHSTLKKDNQCPVCGKIFQFQTSLESHIKTHKGLKQFKCTLCPKVFISLQTLTNHFTDHKKYVVSNSNEYIVTQPDRPFTCNICGLAFRRQFTLRNHKLKHTKQSGTGGFVLMVDMKEDDEEENNMAAQSLKLPDIPSLHSKPPELNYIQIPSTQDITQNYIDVGNGNFLPVQGNTFNIGGKTYILIDDSGKAIEKNPEMEMIVDETLKEDENATNMEEQQQFDNSVMYVQSENNSFVINQNEIQQNFVFTNDKGPTTYMIGGNEFLLQPNEQTF